MPGGSVNGRPFRESVDSYSRTGIPCGNPRRYQSHDVVRMEAGARSRSSIVDGPLETIETEGQKQLQTMLQKQMETKVTMQQQLGQKREFTKGAEYLASSEELTGTRNLSDFIALGEVDKYIEEMKNYGLTHEEILYKVQMENEGSMLKKSKFSNPDYNVSRMAEIDEKIAQKKQALSKPDSFSNAKSLSRHEMELENAIATANTQNRFLHKNLVKERENQSGSNPNDPMNCIPEILEKFSKSKHSDTKKQKKKDKKTYKKECMLECCNSSVVSNCAECSRRKIENIETESDACSSCDTSCQQSCNHEMEIQTCAEKPADYVSKEEIIGNKAKSEKKLPQKSTSFTVKTLTDKTVSEQTVVDSNTKDEEGVADKSNSSKEQNVENVRELENVEAIPEDVIRRYKLSADEVKKLPRFETYTPGEPSNVLFVKNLAPKVTEQDLASLFIQFQDDDSNRIVFKLLNGRMKGQAFVTFSSTEKASQALELVHGYDFKGKPVIVQFGRKSS